MMAISGVGVGLLFLLPAVAFCGVIFFQWVPVQVGALALFTALTARGPQGAEGARGARGVEGETAWTPVFNGKDLEGWKARGNAIFSVEDGCLVGTQTDGKGGDLFTTQEWDNFELRFTYRVTWPANSGVWFRGRYQFDILKYTKPVAYSGTLYCPGKMFLTRNLDESIEKRDDWNEGQVYANGDHLVLWLNGKKVGECHDKTLARGTIGIQVHGGEGFKNMRILIRKMEIRPLQPGDAPTAPASP